MASSDKRATEPINIADKKVVFSIEQLITYSVTFLTIGASIYTFVNALPKLEALDTSLQELKVSNARVDQQISDLKEFINMQQQIQDKQSNINFPNEGFKPAVVK